MYFIDRYWRKKQLLFQIWKERNIGDEMKTSQEKDYNYIQQMPGQRWSWLVILVFPVTKSIVKIKNKKTVYFILPLISTLDLSHVQVELILAPFICMKEFSNCPIGRRTFVLPVQTLHDMAIWHLLPWRLQHLLTSLTFATFSLSSCPGKEHKEEDSRINSHFSKGFEFYWCR